MAGLREILALGAAVVGLSGATCAQGHSDAIDPIRPVVLDLDYNAPRNQAVFSVCSLGGPPQRARPCYLLGLSLSDGRDGATVTPHLLLGGAGQHLSLPVFTPSGDAIYAARRTAEDWARLGFNSPVSIIRLDLNTGAVAEIAQAPEGSFSVAHVLQAPNGDELLVIFETLSLTPQGAPVGSRIVTLAVRDGQPVSGSRATFDDIGAAGLELPMADMGYIKAGVQLRDGRVIARGFWAFTPDDIVAGRHILYPTLEAAITHVAGCEANACTDVVAQRAFAAAGAMRRQPTYDSARMRDIDTEPQNFVVAFNGRPVRFFPVPNDPIGTFQISYDLRGGAVAVSVGPESEQTGYEVASFGSSEIQLRQQLIQQLSLQDY